jgi:hypothetical protein
MVRFIGMMARPMTAVDAHSKTETVAYAISDEPMTE